MKPTLTLTLVTLATLAIAGCSRNDMEPLAAAAISSAHAVEPKAPLYPPIDPNAQDGAVFDYY